MRRYPIARIYPDELSHLALTSTETLCREAVVLMADQAPLVVDDNTPPAADAVQGMCPACVERLGELHDLHAAATSTHGLAWQPRTAPHGADIALGAEAALDADRLLTLFDAQLWELESPARRAALQQRIADLSALRGTVDALVDRLLVASRDKVFPPVTWETLGQSLGVTATPARSRYQRAAETMPDRRQACPHGCGEFRPAQLAGGYDPWKHHDLDHEGFEQMRERG